MQSIQFIGITPEQLRKSIISDLEVHLKDLKKNFTPKQPREYLTRAETAELLKINLSTLYLWTKKGLLTSYGVSGKVYYKRSEVESAIQQL